MTPFTTSAFAQTAHIIAEKSSFFIIFNLYLVFLLYNYKIAIITLNGNFCKGIL